MVDHLLQGRGLCINLIDGPTGPKGVVKPGAVRIAQKSGALLVPTFFSGPSVWQLSSWDRFMIPKPFSSVTLTFEKAIDVPPEMTRQEFEEKRSQLEKVMAPHLL